MRIVVVMHVNNSSSGITQCVDGCCSSSSIRMLLVQYSVHACTCMQVCFKFDLKMYTGY